MSYCKKCQSHDINILTSKETVKYKGQDIPFNIEYSVCNNCNHEFVSKQQIQRGDDYLRDAKKVIDGLLTSSEIKQAREELGLTQAQASQVFGGGANAFSKYERNEVTQSKAMDKLIRVCLDYPVVFNDLKAQEGLSDVVVADRTYENNVMERNLK
ncbi:hypothetical protein GCM10011365_01960 [Marinicella pacifica]|uniref:HTH cro/C1-type domain-containing protein n=1 Tax=Marinicella pacifica TaxID=1171543 RepID=A0A917CE53_9GAMM|nr:type II toxin-antitoxin system MqsA family antitoxin [Marinicella pacifica]GGF84609.1 hypothetical protein GCM10011365_01960 [Marinicella pacifica]